MKFYLERVLDIIEDLLLIKTRSATLPLGHADGIGRQYGNGKGYVIINHKKARILGNVCMDMLMVDVTDITCKEGDEVLVFGLIQLLKI